VVREAMELQSLIAALERDYPGVGRLGGSADRDRRRVRRRGIAGARRRSGPALSLPIMRGLLPALDALLAVGSDRQGEAAAGVIEAIHDAITAAVERGMKSDRLPDVLETWSRAADRRF